MKDDLDVMRFEYQKLTADQAIRSGAAFAKKSAILGVSALQFLNEQYDPFGFSLNGFADQFASRWDEDYKPDVYRIYKSVTRRAATNPYAALAMTFVVQLVTFVVNGVMTRKTTNKNPYAGKMTIQQPSMVPSMPMQHPTQVHHPDVPPMGAPLNATPNNAWATTTAMAQQQMQQQQNFNAQMNTIQQQMNPAYELQQKQLNKAQAVSQAEIIPPPPNVPAVSNPTNEPMIPKRRKMKGPANSEIRSMLPTIAKTLGGDVQKPVTSMYDDILKPEESAEERVIELNDPKRKRKTLVV